MRKVTLVIPCYDEAARLPVDTLRSFLGKLPELHLVLVDDGSRDATRARQAEVAEGLEARVALLGLDENQGKAEAVRRGILRALEGAPDVVGYWDADLATPLEELHGMLAVLDTRPDAEMVFGARVNLLGRRIRRNPWRHYLGRVFATCVSVMLGLPVYDTQCGAKIFRVTPALGGLFAEPFATRWVFDVELIARAVQRERAGEGRRVLDTLVEYPLDCWIDVAGSKLGASDFLLAIYDLWLIRRRYL